LDNVKIHLIEAYEASEKTDDVGWYTIAPNRIRSFLEPSSLVGIPMSDIANFFINFRMKVESMNLRLKYIIIEEPDSITPPGSFKATSKTGNG
jgi:hypothetical protein